MRNEEGRLSMHRLVLLDLRNQVFRPASANAFVGDPLRVFRLARFTAQWPAWTVAEEVIQQIDALSPNALDALAPERVGQELRKALSCPRPDRFFTFLAERKRLDPWFSELRIAETITAGPPPWHHESVFEHSVSLMRATAGDALAVWMALCHDLGKITTPREMLPHHYLHELRGGALVKVLVKRLKLPYLFQKAGTLICREHMKAGSLLSLKIGTRRDLLWQVGCSGLHSHFWKVVNADSGRPLSQEADQELAVLTRVVLPKAYQNRGSASKDKLRELHCQALVTSGVRRERQTQTSGIS